MKKIKIDFLQKFKNIYILQHVSWLRYQELFRQKTLGATTHNTQFGQWIYLL